MVFYFFCSFVGLEKTNSLINLLHYFVFQKEQL